MTPAASPATTAWEGLGRRRFLLTTWPWRALAHTALTLVVWVCFVLPAVVLVVPFAGAVDALRGPGSDVIAAAGLLLLGLALAFVTLPLLASPLLVVDRARARLVDPRPLPQPARAPRGAAAWLRDRYLTPGRWRHAAYLVACITWQTALLAVLVLLGTSAGALLAAPALASRSVPINVGPWQANTPVETWTLAVLGALLLAVLAYAWTLGACLQVALLRWTLVTDRAGELEARLTEVDASRARLVDSFDSERRRIERDLHDGAQQRLVTLAMNLGVARLEVTGALGDEHPATVAVASAHEQSKVLMDELRAFVRGIHPQVLSDVGLVAALDQLTSAMPLPVEVTSDLPTRPPAHVEATAYFSISEALTNVIRHSGARRASVGLTRQGGELVVEVRDDGHGGAAAAAGSGLTGMADRLAAVGGSLWLSSPTDGPTVVRMRIPETR